jgi:hypothetical protein
MTMDMKNFEYLLDLHGADFARWDESDAAAARQLLAASEDARQALARAARLDEFMGAHKTGPLPDIVLARVQQALDRPAYINDNRAGVAARWRVGGMALAACAALVMLVQFAGQMQGTSVVQGPGPRQGTEMAAAQKSDPADPSVQAAEVELFLLAMADPLIETLADEVLTAPLGASAGLDSATIDLFVDDMLEPEIETLGVVR